MNQSKKIRAAQHSRKRHWSQLVVMPESSSSGIEGSRISARVKTPRHLVVRFRKSGLSWSVLVIHTLISGRTGQRPARSSWWMMTFLKWRRRMMRWPASSLLSVGASTGKTLRFEEQHAIRRFRWPGSKRKDSGSPKPRVRNGVAMLHGIDEHPVKERNVR